MMDWKTKVLLFVLVLFGSVVPVSAQDPQGSAGILQNVVVSVSAALGAVVALLAFWWKFDSKIDANAKETNGKIDRTNERIDANARETNGKIDRTNERIDAAKNDLKDDAQKAHAEIGTNIRESEKRLNDNINKVHATVQLLLEQASADSRPVPRRIAREPSASPRQPDGRGRRPGAARFPMGATDDR